MGVRVSPPVLKALQFFEELFLLHLFCGTYNNLFLTFIEYQLITTINLFTLNHIQDPKNTKDYLEISNSDQSCYAKIELSLGGSLQELSLQNKTIISSKYTKPYNESYASAILFPFSNRVELGKYNFDNEVFQLEQNEKGKHNALHGLVYNKSFEVVKQEISDTEASVSIIYNESRPGKGFPFMYAITLDYVLTKNELQLHVTVKNTDNVAFPFSLGWHPYFYSSDIYNSMLTLDSDQKILVSDSMIPISEERISWHAPRKIQNQYFDDCFVLNNSLIKFKTPEYHLEFKFSTTKKYLQIYTPENRKTIAIEPQTAVANSFNSKKGLQVLQPNDSYNLNWKINIE